MTHRSVAIALSLVGAAGLPAAALAAAAPLPVRVAADARAFAVPNLFRDRAGTVHAAWTRSIPSGYRVIVARRPAGKTAFGTTVELPLPAGATSISTPIVYQAPAPSNEIRVLFAAQVAGRASAAEWVARSGDGGASWTTAPLPLVDGKEWAFYAQSAAAVAADGSVRGLIGSVGREQLVTLSPDLATATAVAFATTFLGEPHVALAGDGTVFAVGSGNGSTVNWQVGATTGSTPVPAGCKTPYNALGGASVAAGARDAAALVLYCGTAYGLSIGADGAGGALRRLGAARPYSDPVGIVRGVGGYTATWIGADGDLHQSRSADGAVWKAVPSAIPASRASDSTYLAAVDPSGWSIWSAVEAKKGVFAAPPNVGRPVAPKISTAGLGAARTARLGTTTIAASRSFSFTAVKAGGTISVRIAVSYPDTVTVTPLFVFDSANLQIGTKQVAVKPGAARTVSFTASATGFSLRQGTPIEFRVTTRNGDVTVRSKLG